MKKPYPRSFAKRITWRIMLTMLVVMGIISTIVFSVAMDTIYTESQILCERFVDVKNVEVQQAISDISVACINTIPEIEENLDNPEKMYDIMEQLVTLNPTLHSCGISFIENYYPSKGRQFCPFAVRQDSLGIKRFNFADKSHSYLNAPWFTQALKAKEGYWAPPYIDETDKETPIVSYLTPIHDKKGQTVAVLGADLSLLDLRHNILGSPIINLFGDQSLKDRDSIDLTYKFYYFIIDTTGTYIMHPEEKRMVRANYFKHAAETDDTLDTHLGKEMTAGRYNTFLEDENGNNLTIDGNTVQASYKSVKHTNWSICLVVPTFFINLIGYIFGGVLLFLIGTGLLVVFFAGRFTIKKTVKPLNQLAASANEVAKGHFNTPLPIVKSRDEIHMLRDSFEQMQHSLTQYVEELKATTEQKASIESELKVAHQIQMSMLPKIFPPYPERTDIDIFGKLVPAKAVGGDLFDFYIHDEKLFFCIGDVSGKGVPASLFMAVARSLFRNVSTHRHEPNTIIEVMNNSMSENNDMNMFVTLFVGVLDLHNGELKYCNAGHNSPILIGQDDGFLQCLPNLPIGIMPDFEFVKQKVMLKPQTTIFLYTDGLNEAENANHDQLGDERTLEIAKEQFIRGQHQPQPLIERMSMAVKEFVGEAEQSDDLTMLAIQYLGQTEKESPEKQN